MNKLNLFVHIGIGKTGTTALQSFLGLNRDILKKKGFLYPKNPYPRFPEFNNEQHYLSDLFKDIFNNRKGKRCFFLTNEEEIKLIKAQANEVGAKNIILSSEHFYNEFALGNKKKHLILFDFFNKNNTKIILYIRRQDEWLMSSYFQRIMAEDFCQDIMSHFDTRGMFEADYFNRYNLLKKALPKCEIELQLYGTSAIGKNFYEHFLKIVGLTLTNKFLVPSRGERRISPSASMTKYLKCINAAHQNNGSDIAILRNLKQLVAKFPIDRDRYASVQSLMSKEEMLKIMGCFQESNLELLKNFVRDQDQEIFIREFMSLEHTKNRDESHLISELTDEFVGKVTLWVSCQQQKQKLRTILGRKKNTIFDACNHINSVFSSRFRKIFSGILRAVR